jgi:membrane protease YdiL (CAAX protease family)
MATVPDLLYVALFAVALPLLGYLVFWPALRRRLRADPAKARKRLYAEAVTEPWAVVAVGAALWLYNDRSWRSLGFSVPDGWRLWVPVALALLLVAYTVHAAATLARDSQARASARQQIGKIPDVGPHTRTELYWFGGVSLTAGFCEEFLYRGYFIWALAPWLGWWGAAALSVALFASAHAYQGWNGALRTGVVGTILTLVVAISTSLWPAIVLHVLVDLGSGIIAWLVLREAQATDDVMEVERQPEQPSASRVESNSVQADLGAAPDRGRE